MPLSVFAQLHIGAAGGDYSNQNGTISFTVGQPMTNYLENNPQAVNEGVQQPYEYFSLSNASDLEYLLMEIYPNPTTGMIHLKGEKIKNATIQVIDLNGKIIMEHKIEDIIHSVDLKDLANGVYNLTITNNSQNNTTRIIKH